MKQNWCKAAFSQAWWILWSLWSLLVVVFFPKDFRNGISKGCLKGVPKDGCPKGCPYGCHPQDLVLYRYGFQKGLNLLPLVILVHQFVPFLLQLQLDFHGAICLPICVGFFFRFGMGRSFCWETSQKCHGFFRHWNVTTPSRRQTIDLVEILKIKPFAS